MILAGQALECLKTLPDESVQTVVTSPPYWGLRDYQVDGQIGLEKTIEEYIAKLVEVFREVRRVLRKDGTLWLNLGDSYAGSGRGRDADGEWNPGKGGSKQKTNIGAITGRKVNSKSLSKNAIEEGAIGNALVKPPRGLKPKDLCMIPARVAIALQADGWWLRQDIIWAKPNPMPESVIDRCTKSHEYIFLLTKSAKYYYDADAISEKANYDGRKDMVMKGSAKYANGFVPDQSAQSIAVKGHVRWKKRKNDGLGTGGDGAGFQNHSGYDILDNPFIRNKRSVWTVNNSPFHRAHFATFPEEIPTICIKAGTSEYGACSECGMPYQRKIEKRKANKTNPRPFSKTGNEGDRNDVGRIYKESVSMTVEWEKKCKCKSDAIASCVVLDPFAGSGTTLEVAKRLGRQYIGIELNEKYVKTLIEPRLENIDPLFAK